MANQNNLFPSLGKIWWIRWIKCKYFVEYENLTSFFVISLTILNKYARQSMKVAWRKEKMLRVLNSWFASFVYLSSNTRYKMWDAGCDRYSNASPSGAYSASFSRTSVKWTTHKNTLLKMNISAFLGAILFHHIISCLSLRIFISRITYSIFLHVWVKAFFLLLFCAVASRH